MTDALGRLRRRFGRALAVPERAATAQSSTRRRPLAPVRRRISIEGRIVELTHREGEHHLPALVARVGHTDTDDETLLVWLGRAEIAGLRVGVRLRAHGLVTTHHAHPTIFNPAYDLLPDEDAA